MKAAPDPIYVTGVGLITAIGHNVSQNLQALCDGKTGIGKVQHLKTRHQNDILVGEVKLNQDELIAAAGISSIGTYSRTGLFGLLAVKEALKEAGISDVNEFRTGLISATSVGGMASTERWYLDYLDPNKTGNFLEHIHLRECGESTEFIADHFGLHSYIGTVSTACSSSANALMFGARLIRHGILDRVVVGGTDSLSKFTLNGFMTLRILDAAVCKPFDSQRKGLNLGEGAGFLVLESEQASRGKKRLCRLSGYSNTNDAYHQTAPSPEAEGAFLAMQEAISLANLTTSDISYINAHGTGTELNDKSETIAMQRLFGNSSPLFSSTKAFTGHTLAACGAIEAVFAVLAITNRLIFPNLNFKESMPGFDLIPQTSLLRNQQVDHVLSNSFGFGGSTSSLLFSR